MSGFSDYLNWLLKERNLSGAQAAKLCGLDASVVFRWLCGSSLPQSWKRLEGMAKKLRLSPNESASLEQVYRKEVLGESASNCFCEIVETMRVVAEKRNEYVSGPKLGQEPCMPYFFRGGGKEVLPEFLELNGKTDIIQCIQNAFFTLAARQEEELYLKLDSLPEWLLIQLKQLKYQSENTVEMLLGVNQKGGAHKAAEIKLKRLRQVIDLLAGKDPVCIYYCNTQDGLGQMGQEWLVSDRFLVQFSGDLSRGMLTRDPEWIAFFKDMFRRWKKHAKQICKGTKEVLEFLGEQNRPGKLKASALGFMPCLSIGLTNKILQEGILPELAFQKDLIRRILEYPNSVSQLQQLCSYFTKEGLRCFMETGRLDEFPYPVYEPLCLEKRCEVLGNIIAIWEEMPQLHYILLKDDFADLRGISVERRLGDYDLLCLYIHFEEGKKEMIEILDCDIKREYVRFFRYLKDSGYAYSENETLQFMKETLKEWRGKGAAEAITPKGI